MIDKEKVKSKGLLFDGAFGTYFSSLHPHVAYSCEVANLKAPAWVKEIHEAYIRSGAEAIKTNTFCNDIAALQCEEQEANEILIQGYQLAHEAAQGRVEVVADIGPIVERKDQDAYIEYKRIVDVFLACKAENFLFETLHNELGIHEICAYIKQICPNSFVMVSYAINADGYTRQGISGKKLFANALEDEHIDSVGFNCICGPHHLNQYSKQLDLTQKIVSIMPNAGYPTILNNRAFFADTSTYFANELKQIRALGVSILGGCCGTTPAYIEKVKQIWEEPIHSTRAMVHKDSDRKQELFSNKLVKKLAQGKKLIAVELDPPSNCDIQKFMENALVLQDAGVDTITIADCPIARARVDSSLLAAKVKRELGLEVIPHMTCRDRNINATKALLYGLQIENITNVLVVTGDPIPQAERNEIKAVFNFNSQILANYIHDLNETTFPKAFTIYGSLNINAVNFQAELKKAQQKEACGVTVFMSQPVLSKQAIDNLLLAKHTLKGKILGGIIPIVSYRNAVFMNNEVAGINVDEAILHLYEGKNREEAEELAIKITCAIVDEIRGIVDGYYLITPFNRVTLIQRILQYIQVAEEREAVYEA